MGNIKVWAGDFLDDEFINNYSYLQKTLTLRTIAAPQGEIIHRSTIVQITIANEENVTKAFGIAGKALWEIAGGILRGPIGLAFDRLTGDKGKKIPFLLNLDDGRTLLGVTDSDTYKELLGGKIESPIIQTDKYVEKAQKSVNPIIQTDKYVEKAQKSVNEEGGLDFGIGCFPVLILGIIFILLIVLAAGSETLPPTLLESTHDNQNQKSIY